jgi:hypothetical protein
MVGRLGELARIALWAIPWAGALGVVLGPERPQRVRIGVSETEPPGASELGFVILAQHGVCFSPGPELHGVAPLRVRGR